MTETNKVTFTYKPVISVESINLVGDFNDWDSEATPMVDENGDGTYKATLELETGEYEYKILINGVNWQKPSNSDHYVKDGFGGKNGVMKVGGSKRLLEAALKGDSKIITEGLMHDNTKVRFANPLDDNKVSIKFQTKKNDVEEVILHYNDGEEKKVKLEQFVTHKYFDYYRAIIEVENPIFTYDFEIRDGEKTVLYDKQGVKEVDEEKKAINTSSFEYDLSTKEVFETPDWVQDAIFYQIFPDRFYNGNPANDPDKIELYKNEDTLHDAVIPDWEQGVPPGPPVITENTDLYDNHNAIKPEAGHYVFYGGDLQGIEQKLSYLERLGINAIYLNPIFKATSSHNYNTAGYEFVDDTLAIKGDLEASEEYMIQLIEKLHSRNIKVIFDAVFNHTGYEHWAFQDIVENGEDSDYVDWYRIESFPIVPLYRQNEDNPPNYDCWWGFGHLPELNVANPEVQEYIFEVTEKWMDPKGNGDLRAGVDGWRLDVPNEVKEVVPDFWKEWRKFVKGINPEAYIVGEIWTDASDYLEGDEFDSVMNYRFRDAVIRFIGLQDMTANEFANELNKLYLQYPEQANRVMFNLIGSHDTTRYLTVINEDKERLKLTAFFQMTYTGAPVIYYGDEIGMKGEDGSDCRRTMIWKDRGYTKPDYDLFEHYQKLIKLRKEEVALRRGRIQQVKTKNNQVYAFKRIYKEQELLIVVNAGDQQVNLEFDLNITDRKYEDLYREKMVKIKEERLSLNLAGVSGAILKLS